MTLTRIPILIGSGLPLFGELPGDVHLDHIKTKTFMSGFVQSHYEVRKDRILSDTAKTIMRPNAIFPVILFLSTALLFMAGGCTSTTVTFHSTGTGPPLCRDSSRSAKTVIYWSTAWRADQKEITRREAIIAKGIDGFFRTTPCFSVQTISRTIDGRDVLLLGDKDILASVPADVERIHILRFEELGPVLVLYLSPILWTSDLDIQLRVRTLNARTGSLESRHDCAFAKRRAVQPPRHKRPARGPCRNTPGGLLTKKYHAALVEL